MDIIRHPGEDLFFEAILSLRTVEDCRLFFEDVATIKELQAMSQRFRVACLLDGGENYIEVSESTGASSATADLKARDSRRYSSKSAGSRIAFGASAAAFISPMPECTPIARAS